MGPGRYDDWQQEGGVGLTQLLSSTTTIATAPWPPALLSSLPHAPTGHRTGAVTTVCSMPELELPPWHEMCVTSRISGSRMGHVARAGVVTANSATTATATGTTLSPGLDMDYKEPYSLLPAWSMR